MNTFQTQPQKTNTFQEKHKGITMWRIRHNVYPHLWVEHVNRITNHHTMETRPHVLPICSIATRTRKNALPEILFGGWNHSMWIAINFSSHPQSQKFHTKPQTTSSQYHSNSLIHYMAQYTTNTSPTIIQRSRHLHAIGPATFGSNPTAPTIETRNLRYLQQHIEIGELWLLHTKRNSVTNHSRIDQNCCFDFGISCTRKKCMLRTMSNAHTLRNGIGGGRGTTSRHAQRHGYRVSKSDRMFIRQSLTIHTWTIKLQEEPIHQTNNQIESPLTQIVTSHQTFRLKTTCCTKLCVPGTMCHTTRPFQNK